MQLGSAQTQPQTYEQGDFYWIDTPMCMKQLLSPKGALLAEGIHGGSTRKHELKRPTGLATFMVLATNCACM